MKAEKHEEPPNQYESKCQENENSSNEVLKTPNDTESRLKYRHKIKST